ncbi:hypothetical protein KIW84_UN0414 [Lathyrus oleraceus]|nr:hypothetical protein KIW84_UN0414 [Pisum sativum]
MRLSREATEQRFKEYKDQCIEEFCVAQEQQQRIKECRAEAHQRIRGCRVEYRADAEQRIKKLRADAEQRINEFRAECRVETEQRIKECRAETKQRIKECRVEYGAAAGQRIKECGEEAEQRINEFRADPVITLCGHLFCWPCLYKWLHHRSHPQECPVCKGVVGEEKLVPLYGKGRSVTDPRTEIPPRPSDIHTLFASLEQTRLSREATEQRFKEYIDQCIEEFCVAQEQHYRIKKFRAEAEQRIKECRAEADQRIRECRAEYRADAEQRIKKLRADAEQRINEFRAECRVETEQRIKECRAETKQRIKECRVEYGAAAGQRIKECREEAEQRINEFRADPVITLCGHLFCWPCLYKWLHHRSHPQECPVCKGVVGEEKLVPLYGKGRSVTDPRTEIPPRPSDIHTLFASLEQTRLSREATEQRFKEYIDQCIEEFCVAQEQHYRIKKFRAEAEQRIKECRAEAAQRIRECRAEYRADAEQRIKKLRADAEQRINEFRAECRVETEQRIKECRAETEQRIKECRVEYGAAAGQRIKECREEAEQRINEFRADPVITLCGHLFCWPCLYKWLHHRSHPQECPVCKGVVGEEKLVPLYGKGRSVTDPRTEIPPRPSDIHTLFASLEQTRLSREATEQRFKEYIDQCIEEFCVAQEQHYRIKKFRAEAEQRIKECRAEADQRIRECRAEYRADAEQRIKKLRADAEQRINEFRAECRVETEQRIKECRAETKQRIKECRVEYGAAAGQRIKECREEAEQRINEFRADPVITLCGHLFCWPCLYKWLHHRSHPQECPVCKGVVGEEKLVPLYGKGRSVTDPRTEIPPRPSDIHTLFASLEQTRLSREATEQRFKEYIDQCIEEFCVAQEQHYRIKKFRAEAEQRIKECRAEADQRIRECRAEYRADAEQRIKKLRADAEQCINEFRAECRVETEQRIKECRAETKQRIKECRVEYGAAAGQRIKECREEAEQRINEFRADPVITLCGHLFCWPCLYKWLHHRSHPQECPVCKGVVGEEKLVPLYGKGRSVTDPRTEIPPRPSDIHTLFASLEQMRLSREATEQRFKEYIDQCIEEFCVAQEQHYRIKKFRAEAEQRIKECRAEADQRIRECRAEYRADAEQRIKKLRADAEQRINEFRAECRVETEQRIKECRAETKQRIKECRVEYGAAAGQRIKECREEAEQRINEFRADPVITLCGHLFCWPCLYKWLHHRSHPQECPVCKGVVGEEKLVPLYGKGRSVTDPRTEIPPRPSDIHTLFASLEQTRLSREATEQRFKEYIDQCIEEFCVAQEQHYRIKKFRAEAEQRIKECRAEAAQRIRECRAEYRADAEQRIKKLRADAEQRINEFRAECRVETEQRIKECRAETEQRIKECRVEYGAAAGQRIKECREEAEQRINEFRADPVITLCGHLFCWPCLYKWLHHRSHPQECPVCKGVVGEEKLVPLYGKGRSVTDPRTEIPPRPSDIHTLFASLEQTRLSREATEQRFKEYIDQCIEEFCVAQEQHYRIKKFRAEAEQRIKECRAEADQRIRECRAEYRADAEQRIKKLRADAEQRINEFRAECRVETEQRIKECRAETKQRIKECRVEYGAAAGQRIKECREEAERRINETEIPPRPSDIHTLFASLEQTRLSREATEQRFKEYIDQCIEEFCVAQEQRIALLQEAQERQADQRIRECRAEYRADAEQRIKKLRADAEQRINEFRAECRVETEQRIKECRAETEQRIKECRVEYGAAAGQRIKECREEAEQRINEFRADPVITLCGHLFCWPCLYKWLHHRSHPQECPVCKGVVGEEKLVPLYGKGRSVTDPRTEIPPRPSDIHTLFASLEQMRLSREATEQRFKEYIDQCIEEFCVAQEQHYRIKKFRAEAEQRIKECRAEADQRIRECRAEYRADAEQRIKKLRADAEQRINEFRAECRVETEQRIKECRAETKQRIKECRVEYGAAAGQRIKECREEAERRINEFRAIWEER